MSKAADSFEKVFGRKGSEAWHGVEFPILERAVGFIIYCDIFKLALYGGY